MEQNEALRILQHLADGIDPHSGEVFDEGSPYQHPQVVRALFYAVRVLEQNGATLKGSGIKGMERSSLPEARKSLCNQMRQSCRWQTCQKTRKAALNACGTGGRNVPVKWACHNM